MSNVIIAQRGERSSPTPTSPEPIVATTPSHDTRLMARLCVLAEKYHDLRESAIPLSDNITAFHGDAQLEAAVFFSQRVCDMNAALREMVAILSDQLGQADVLRLPPVIDPKTLKRLKPKPESKRKLTHPSPRGRY